jgi:thiamine-phosphate pyrophosphorylase
MSAKPIARLQFLTFDTEELSHAQQAELACAGGIRWVQCRMKSGTDDQRLAETSAVKTITDRYGATLIINDDVRLAQAIGADGVHLGKTDMDITHARDILGDEVIIGGTANTVADILSLAAKKADYIGLGPYRFTPTKQLLSPILGTAGYRNILNELSAEGISIPVIAIGGIRLEDIPLLQGTGVHGIAISSAIYHSPDITAAAREWTSACQYYFQPTTVSYHATDRR